jgi:hypothetical protein
MWPCPWHVSDPAFCVIPAKKLKPSSQTGWTNRVHQLCAYVYYIDIHVYIYMYVRVYLYLWMYIYIYQYNYMNIINYEQDKRMTINEKYSVFTFPFLWEHLISYFLIYLLSANSLDTIFLNHKTVIEYHQHIYLHFPGVQKICCSPQIGLFLETAFCSVSTWQETTECLMAERCEYYAPPN